MSTSIEEELQAEGKPPEPTAAASTATAEAAAAAATTTKSAATTDKSTSPQSEESRDEQPNGSGIAGSSESENKVNRGDPMEKELEKARHLSYFVYFVLFSLHICTSAH